MREYRLLGQVGLLLELFVDSEVRKVLDVPWDLGEGGGLGELLDLGVDAALAGSLVELPLGDL